MNRIVYSLSLSFPVRGAGHRPNPFQEVPEASWVRVELSSRPDVPSGLLMSGTMEDQVLRRLVSAIAVWTGGGVPAPDPVEIACQQRRMASA